MCEFLILATLLEAIFVGLPKLFALIGTVLEYTLITVAAIISICILCHILFWIGFGIYKCFCYCCKKS